MEICIKNQAFDRFIEEVAEAFYDLCPGEAAAFEKIVEQESQSLVKPSGMSKDGTMLSYCKLPHRLYSFMKWQGHKRLGIDDIFRDRENYYQIAKIWTNCAIKRTPTRYMRIHDGMPVVT